MVSGGGSETITLRTDEQYSDGTPHTIMLVKRQYNFQLFIDDIAKDSNRLMKDSSSRIEAMNSGGLFLGGVPEGFRVENMAATDKPFEGCISDIIHNKVLISLDKPTSFNSVELGRCSLPHKLPPTIPPPPPISFPPWQLPRLLDTSTVATVYETTDATDMTEEADGVSQEMFSNEATTEMPESVDSCTPPGRYEKEEHAVKFGDQQHSFSIIHVVKRDIQQNFIMRFHFRTYEPNGMLVYIGNHGDTQHVAGQLAEGRFVLSLNYNNVQELKSGTGGLNDGQWHNVTIHKRKSKLKMSVDERGEQASKVKRKLNVKPMIYVGGLPANITNTVGVVKQGFQGCVKNFRFNSDPINLAGVNTTSQGVTHCYTNVETGAYFAGDAYAIYEEQFKTGMAVEIELSFRTSVREGVLLSTAAPSGSPSLTLQLYDGQVVITVDLGEGQGMFNATAPRAETGSVCDGAWHKVEAAFLHSVVTIRVDDRATQGGYNRQGNLRTNSAFYVGGFPDTAYQQGAALTTKKFVGCMKHLVLNNMRRDWKDMAMLHYVQLDCPKSGAV